MRRLYFLTGNLDSTEQISNDIHRAGITDWHFHVISKDEAGLYRRKIHGANLILKHDVIRFAERGAMAGFVIGLVVTGFVMGAQPFGPGISGLAYAAIFAVVTLFGTWVGGLTGLATENQAIARFHSDIDAGQYLILIDVRKEQENAIRELMATQHSEARLVRVGSTFANPFVPASTEPA